MRFLGFRSQALSRLRGEVIFPVSCTWLLDTLFRPLGLAGQAAGSSRGASYELRVTACEMRDERLRAQILTRNTHPATRQVPGHWSFDTGWHNMDVEYLHAGSVGAVIRAGTIFFLFAVLCSLRASTRPFGDVGFSVLRRLRSNARDLFSRERILVTILCVIK